MSTTTKTPFAGLAPFLRKSIAGSDIRPIAREMLELAGRHPDDADLWMNLSIVMLCLEQRDIGLAIQAQALESRRVYHLAASESPARLRLLMLMAPGDLAANTPLECLLENSDIDLHLYYVSAGYPLAAPLPEHDALIVCIGETGENREYLAALEPLLAHWPKPVINAPQHIGNTERAAASRLLQGIPGLFMPLTRPVTRSALLAMADGRGEIGELLDGGDFPVILRPLGSHAGHNLERIEHRAAMADYLDRVAGDAFFLSRFIDYSGPDGLFRKFRIALVGGRPLACHMAVSAHWMVHYVNASMYEDAAKRAEEAAFMDDFAAFADRHAGPLAAIHQRSELDYLCIDCAETADGQLLVFEIDHAMVVHAMDPEDMFPYKQAHMQKVQHAFREFLCTLLPATTPR